MSVSLSATSKKSIIREISEKVLSRSIDSLNNKIKSLNNILILNIFNLEEVKQRRQAYLEYVDMVKRYPLAFIDSYNTVTKLICIPNARLAILNFLSNKEEYISLFDLCKYFYIKSGPNSIFNKSIINDSYLNIPYILSGNRSLSTVYFSVIIDPYVYTSDGKSGRCWSRKVHSDTGEDSDTLIKIQNILSERDKVTIEELSKIMRQWSLIVKAILSKSSDISLYKALPALKENIERITNSPLDPSIIKEQNILKDLNKMIEEGIPISK